MAKTNLHIESYFLPTICKEKGKIGQNAVENTCPIAFDPCLISSMAI